MSGYRSDDALRATWRSKLIICAILAWMSWVLIAYLIENSNYFREKLLLFLPLLGGHSAIEGPISPMSVVKISIADR